MNMCSVRQRPMPSAPSSRARRASAGVSAFARTPSVRSSSDQPQHAVEARVDARRDQRHVVERDVPASPSIAIRSPACSTRSPIRTVARAQVDVEVAAPVTAGRPMPRATSAACDALPPSRGQDALGGVEAGDVVGLGERAHEDHGATVLGGGDRLLGGEDDRALGGARRGRDAARDDA